ncbi:MAG: hypothetical protein M5R36_05835 [Deltaproteobacteria bacterium]|nr:hypothetical protein [Deltaproteobacteria bacterium]
MRVPRIASRSRCCSLAVQGDRAVKAWHSQKGALPGFAYAEGDDLEKVRLAAEADRVGVFPADLFARTFAAWQRAIVHDDDWDRQITAIAETVRPMLRREIRWHPGPPWRLPEKSTLPSLERRAKRLWPDGTCVGFFRDGGTDAVHLADYRQKRR